jgi:hypothetical protein
MPVITKPAPRRSWRPAILEALKSRPEGMTRHELNEILKAESQRDRTIIMNELIKMRKANDIAVSNGVFTIGGAATATDNAAGS